MRTYYWYLTAYLRKHGWVVLSSILVAILFFSFLIPAIVNRIGQKPRTYVGMVGTYTLNSLPPSVETKISRGLTTISPDGTPLADLAERWTVEDDGKIYRFILKKNLVWQDGKPLAPEHITYNFRDVEMITTPNDLVFKLKDPFTPFPNITSKPIFRAEDQPYFLFFKRPILIGLGEYEVINYKRNGERLTQLIIENADETLIYRFYITEDDAILGFKRGEIDKLVDMTSVSGLETWPTVTVTKTLNTSRYLAVFFNNDLYAKNVRQALSYATEKPTDETRAIGPISPTSWAYFPGGKTYDYDIDRAIERLMDELPQQHLTFELTTPATFQGEAEKIKQQWEALGDRAVTFCQGNKDITDKNVCQNLDIQVTLRINNFPDTSNYQVMLIGQESLPDPDQYYLWHSSQTGTNFTHYKNTRIDSLLEKGRQTQNRDERLAIYQEFQQFFLEDAPAIFLRYLDTYEVERK